MALAAALSVPAVAAAAVSYRITTEPAEPLVAEPVTILVATFEYVDPPATPTQPLPLDEFSWTFVADSPSGGRDVIALDRVGSIPNQWAGRFTFDEPGRWEVGLDERHLGIPVDPSLGARIIVEVRDDSEPNAVALGLLVLAAAAIASLVWYRKPARP
jgi:hypothetical protein